jgi:hypothetical protein
LDPVFNDLQPELSGRESNKLEAGRERNEVEAGRESNEVEAGREINEVQAAGRILHSQLLRIFTCWVRVMGRGTV